MQNRSDTQLVQQTLKGDTDAFRELIERYRSPVYATVLQRIGHFVDAQDVAQETFIEAYRSLPSLRDPATFPGWLHTIACHRCNRWLRARRQHVSIEDLDAVKMLEISENQIDRTTAPDTRLDQQEVRQLVVDAISSLPEKIAEAITLYYIDDLSYDEIARFLDIPTSTVKGRLQQGRKQLKEKFIAMVEETLKQQRPDERFTEKVLDEIVRQADEARQRNAHDQVIQLCDRALDVLNHLDANPEHNRARSRILNWRGLELTRWFGQPDEGAASFQEAARTAASAGDHESRSKYLMWQLNALARTGDFSAVSAVVRETRTAFAELDDSRDRHICDAIEDLLEMLPPGWEPVHSPPEAVSTGFAVQRYSLRRTGESLSYVDESRAIFRLFHLGSGLWSHDGLPFRLGQPDRILVFPPTVGRTWSGEVQDKRHQQILTATRTIESNTDTVVIPAGRFENCLRVATLISEQPDADFSDNMKTYYRRTLSGLRTMWFAPGVGLVRYRHEEDEWDHCHDIQLTDFQVETAKRDDYFPLDLGNRWQYERFLKWCNLGIRESYRVTGHQNEEVHLACAMYSDGLDDTAQRHYFQTGFDRDRESGDLRGQAWMLHYLANALARLRDLQTAESTYGQLDRLLTQIDDAKLSFAMLHATEDANPVEFVAQRCEKALQIARQWDDPQRQQTCLAMLVDLGFRRGCYQLALDAAQRRLPIVIEQENLEQHMYAESEIDLAHTLINSPEGRHALKGGTRSSWRIEQLEDRLDFDGVGGIHPMACDRRPFPPVFHSIFWSRAPLLKLPSPKGTAWTHSDNDGTWERRIEATDEKIQVPAGTFTGCVRIQTTARLRTPSEGSSQIDAAYQLSRGFIEGDRWMWFAPGTGIVKTEHRHANGKRTVVELTGYESIDPDESLFPLSIGNWWTYEWRDENGDLLFKEKERVVLKKEDGFYLACSGYTTNTVEYGE